MPVDLIHMVMLAKNQKLIAKLWCRDLAQQPVPAPRVKCLRKLGRKGGREGILLSQQQRQRQHGGDQMRERERKAEGGREGEKSR